MNQLITNANPLPKGFEWQIHNYYTPNGVKKMKDLKFKHFPQAKWRFEQNGFHLFELTTKKGNVIMAYCIIVKTKKS